MRRPLDLGGLERLVTASIGIGLSVSDWEPPEEILRRADGARYRAKEAGKARVTLLDPSANESTSPQAKFGTSGRDGRHAEKN